MHKPSTCSRQKNAVFICELKRVPPIWYDAQGPRFNVGFGVGTCSLTAWLPPL